MEPWPPLSISSSPRPPPAPLPSTRAAWAPTPPPPTSPSQSRSLPSSRTLPTHPSARSRPTCRPALTSSTTTVRCATAASFPLPAYTTPPSCFSLFLPAPSHHLPTFIRCSLCAPFAPFHPTHPSFPLLLTTLSVVPSLAVGLVLLSISYTFKLAGWLNLSLLGLLTAFGAYTGKQAPTSTTPPKGRVVVRACIQLRLEW